MEKRGKLRRDAAAPSLIRCRFGRRAPAFSNHFNFNRFLVEQAPNGRIWYPVGKRGVFRLRQIVCHCSHPGVEIARSGAGFALVAFNWYHGNQRMVFRGTTTRFPSWVTLWVFALNRRFRWQSV